MAGILRKGTMKKYNRLIILGAIIYVLGLAGYIIVSYYDSKSQSLADVDARLAQGIEVTQAVFSPEGIAKALAGEMSDEEYGARVGLLDTAVRALG